MAGSFSDYLEDKILDHITGKTSFTMPIAYVALGTGASDTALTGEPSGDNYSRVTTSGADWDAASGGATANAQELTFPEASGSWGTMTHFALYDAATVGNMLAWGDLDASKAIGSGDTAKFAVGDLDITLD